MLREEGRRDTAVAMALEMARRMLARGRSQDALGFLEPWRNLDHPAAREARALSELAVLTTDGATRVMTGESGSFSLIGQLSDQEALEFFRLARMCQVGEGNDVVREGEVGESFFLILEGGVRVHMATGAQGRVGLNRLGPGQFFGEIACVYGLPRSATVTAVCPARLLEFPRGALDRLMRRSPMAGEALMRTVQMRMGQSLAHGHPAMDGVLETDRRWLAEESQILEYQRGESIEVPSDAWCVLVHGQARLVMVCDGQSRSFVLEPNEMFGHISPYLRLPEGSVLTAAQRCLVVCVPGGIFHAFMNAYGGFEAWVIRYAAERARRWKEDAAGAETDSGDDRGK